MGYNEDEEFSSASVRELFDTERDMTLKTETPSRMVLPMVRLALIQAATDKTRKKSLLQIFREEFDKRMISKERKGRLELLAAMQAAAPGDGEEEVGL